MYTVDTFCVVTANIFFFYNNFVCIEIKETNSMKSEESKFLTTAKTTGRVDRGEVEVSHPVPNGAFEKLTLTYSQR